MLNKKHISILLILLTISVSYGQSKNFNNQKRIIYSDSIEYLQIKTDSHFNSNQIINLLKLPKTSFDEFSIEFGHSNLDLRTTSSFGKNENALASINGGFFDMDSGGSVSYFEINDSVISWTKKTDLTDRILNGAIVITKERKFKLEHANSEQFYELSKQESAVLVTGPLLILDSKKIKLPDINFVNNRHPRTCLGLNEESVILITIDGRQKEAEGMSLIEVQEFLINLGCVDAINLDGGGSTTMWIQDEGVVNYPSDKTGERPVSNVILIIDESNKAKEN